MLFRSRRGVSLSSQNHGYWKLIFRLYGTLVSQEGYAQHWEACPGQQAGWYRVEVYLHRLLHFLRQGYTRADAFPFQLGPRQASKVVIHLCEKPGCCCPWHLDYGGKRENQLRARAQPPKKRDRRGRFMGTKFDKRY